MSWKEIWDWTDNYLGSGSWEFLLLLFLWISFFSRWGFCYFYFLERRDWVHLTMPYALPQHIFLDLERVLYGSFLNGSCMSLSWTGLEGTWGKLILEMSLICFLEWVLKGLEGNGYLKRLWFIFLNGSCRDLSGTDTWNVPDLFSWMGLEGTWGELILEMSLICFLEWVLKGLEANGYLKCPWFVFLNGSWRDLRGTDTWKVPDLFSWMGLERTWEERKLEMSLIYFLRRGTGGSWTFLYTKSNHIAINPLCNDTFEKLFLVSFLLVFVSYSWGDWGPCCYEMFFWW